MEDLEKFLKYFIIAGIFAIAVLVPFVFSNTLFFPYVAGKAIFFRVVVTILIGAWIILFSLNKRYLPSFNWITITFLSFLFWMAIANIFGDSLFHSFWSNFERMEGYLNLIYIFVFFLVSASVLEKKTWFSLFKVSIITAIFMGIIALGEYMEGVSRADGLLGNPIYLAGYMLTHAFFAFYFFISRIKENIYIAIFYLFTALFFILTVLITGTRGAMLGLVVGMFFATLAIALRKEENTWIKRVAYGGLGISLVIGGILFSIVLVNNYEPIKDTDWTSSFREAVNDVPVMSRFSRISFTEGDAKARFLLWEIAVDGIKERPFLGRGQGNYINLFNYKYRPELFERETWFDRSHNIFLEWGVAGGIPGMLLYIAIFIVSVFLLWRSKDTEYYTKVMFTALLLAYAIHNFFVFDNITSYVFFALIFAFIVTITTTNDSDGNSKQTDSLFSFETVKFVILPLVIISFSVLTYGVHIRSLQANRMITQGMLGIECGKTLGNELGRGQITPQFINQVRGSRCERFLPSDIFSGLNQNIEYSSREIFDHIFIESLSEFKKAREISPIAKIESIEMLSTRASDIFRSEASDSVKTEFLKIIEEGFVGMTNDLTENTRSLIFLGHFYLSLERNEDAIEVFESALETAPNRQHVLLPLGRSYRKIGEYEKAKESYRQAHELEPRFVEPALGYAASLLLVGDEKGFEKVLEDFSREDIVFENSFKSFLVDIEEFEYLIDLQKDRIEILWEDFSDKDLSEGEIRRIGQEYVDLMRFYKENGEDEKARDLADGLVSKIPELERSFNEVIEELEL